MNLKNIKKNFIEIFFYILLIFVIDRLSKIYVTYLDNKNIDLEIYSSKFLNIILVRNEGIAFGLLTFEEIYLYNILTFIILFIIFGLLYFAIKSVGLKKYSYIMVLGGAIGNVFDRVLYRSVPDFLDFHIGNFHWFIFNIADIFITLGVICLIILEITDNNKINKI
tara:strand:- start:4099 stop:4596 length:498 start_codon:yes stop_codon:yes gene_type:complete